MATIISNSTSILKKPVIQVLTVESAHKLNNRPRASCLTSTRNRRFRSLKRSSFKYSNAFTVPKIKIRCSSAGGIMEISESEFSNVVLKSDRSVLVEFVANWCGPCRLMAPAIESIAQEYGDRIMVVKIDHDANPRLIEEYKVYGLPALILFKNGKEVPESRREGAFTKAKLKEYLDSLFESLPVA